MPTELYLNKTFFDTQRNKYRSISKVDSGANWVKMKTECGKFLIIFYDLDDPKDQRCRLEWLINIRQRERQGETEEIDLNDFIAFPKVLLAGLKRSEVGYVTEINNECTLNYYIYPSKGEKLFKWYYDKTGGILYRLKIAYMIASALQKIHSKGYCLVEICPTHTHLQEFNTEEKQLPIIQFSGADRISSYTYPPVTLGAANYCDPLVYTGRSGASSTSDTYSYAVMLFELMTTCHPFVGEDAVDLSSDEVSKAIDSGKLDYIGNKNSDRNKNEDFEDMQIFLPEDLAILFDQMFVEGKFNASVRPTIEEFKAAIIKSLRKIVKCDHKGCQRDYPFNQETTCPFCGNRTQKVLKAQVKKIISASEKLLIPYDGIKEFSALPVIEEDINFVVIREGLNKITRTFFEPDAIVDKGNIGLLIYYSPEKNKIDIRNQFTKFNIKVGGKELKPYTKGDKWRRSDMRFSDNKEIIIELPENAQIEPESIVKIDSKEYGSISYKWVITIR